MVVGIGVIDVHVLEKPSDVLVEEALDLAVIEFGVNKESANVRFDDVGEGLKLVLATMPCLTSVVRIPLELSWSESNSLVPH